MTLSCSSPLGRRDDEQLRHPAVALASGDGAVVTDVDGKSYLDLLGGIAVNVLGHRHPAVIEAVTPPARHARPHLQPLRHRARRSRCAEALVGHLGGDDRRGCSCATPAPRPTRSAFKITAADRAHQASSPPRAPSTAAPWESLALTGQAGQAGAVRRRCPATSPTCPTATSTRWRPRSSTEHRRGVPGADHGGGRGRRAARRATWSARPARSPRPTARCWSSTRCRPVSAAPAPVLRPPARRHQPDVVTLAKGLGGGLPIGACLAFGDAGEPAHPGPARQHLRRQPGVRRGRAGGPARHSADEDLVARADVLGKTLSHGIEALGHPLIDHVRGAGLLLRYRADRAGRQGRRDRGTRRRVPRSTPPPPT